MVPVLLVASTSAFAPVPGVMAFIVTVLATEVAVTVVSAGQAPVPKQEVPLIAFTRFVASVVVLAVRNTHFCPALQLVAIARQLYMVPLMVIVAPPPGSDTIRIGLLAAVGALAVRVSVPIVTVAPPIALFAETVPTALALVVVPSVVVPPVQTGVAVPLCDPATPHPPPVHFWSLPLVSTTSLFNAKAEDGVQGPTVGAVPLVMLKLIK